MKNKKQNLKKVIKLYDAYHNGEIPTIENHEVNPGLAQDSRENYIYFTLPVSINFQRSSPAMWAAALKTYEDPATNYLFFPELVVQKRRSEVQRDLTKHKLALQKNKHTDIWIRISKTFNEFFSNDPRVLLAQGNQDIGSILNIVQKKQKKDFPYLSGPKMANYWLYILTCYTDAKFSNMSEISIIPDTHVQQCSIELGFTTAKDNQVIVSKVWKELLNGSPISPVEMHPVLWNWSRNNFLPKV